MRALQKGHNLSSGPDMSSDRERDLRAIEIGPFGQRLFCEPSLTSQNTHRLSVTSTQLLENLTASNTHTDFAKMT